MNKKNFFILIFFLLVFCVTSIYFLMSNVSLRESLKNKLNIEDIERKMSAESGKIRAKFKKDLSDKRKADGVSYRAIVKRLEMEEKKQLELKSKIDQLEKEVNE